jgi:hypothetical protein
MYFVGERTVFFKVSLLHFQTIVELCILNKGIDDTKLHKSIHLLLYLHRCDVIF